jgi:hypothetical protein
MIFFNDFLEFIIYQVKKRVKKAFRTNSYEIYAPIQKSIKIFFLFNQINFHFTFSKFY